MKKRIAVLVIAIMLLGIVGACAQPVRNAEGQFVIAGTLLEDDSSATVTVDTVQLLGRDGANYLIYADGKLMKVAPADLGIILTYADTSALKSTADFEILAKGSRGEGVKAIQEALKTLGYLSGSADGDLGNQSARAITNFQEAMGFEPTGEADAIQQMLMISMGAEEFVIDSSMDPKGRFAALDGKTDVNLDALYASTLSMTYDAFEGKGFIGDGATISYDASGESDLEQAEFTMQYGLDVKEVAADKVTVKPVIKLDCLCARRPVMQNLILKVGNSRATLPVSELTNSLSGVKSVESCTVVLDDQALALLQNAAEGVQMRVEAKYQSFDITVDEEHLAGIADFCRVAGQL